MTAKPPTLAQQIAAVEWEARMLAPQTQQNQQTWNLAAQASAATARLDEHRRRLEAAAETLRTIDRTKEATP